MTSFGRKLRRGKWIAEVETGGRPRRLPDSPDHATCPAEWADGVAEANNRHGIRDFSPPVGMEHEESGEQMTLVTYLLGDGSSYYGISYRGGSRWARIRPETGFAIEESRDVDPPEAIAESVDRLYASVISSLVDANRRVRDEGL